MRQLTRTRAYWGPFLLGVVARLVLLGMAQTPIRTGGWIDLVPVILMLAAFGAAVASLGRELERWGVPLVPPIGWLAVAAGLLVHTAERRALFENTDEMQETFGALAAVCSAYALRYRRAGLLGDNTPH